VTALPSCEFRDPDGSYVLVQPFDEVRCRVLASNVADRGEVLFKDGSLTWSEAAEDVGGFTRVGPSTLLEHPEKDPVYTTSDLLAALEEKVVPEAEGPTLDFPGEIVGPESLNRQNPLTREDLLSEAFFRLMRKVRKTGRSRERVA